MSVTEKRSDRTVKKDFPICFICDEKINGKGICMHVGQTFYSRTGIPTKIGQLVGEGFMVVISMEDELCRRCMTLINQLDKLELDLNVVKSSLTGYLRIKYNLDVPDKEDKVNTDYVQMGYLENGSRNCEILNRDDADTQAFVHKSSLSNNKISVLEGSEKNHIQNVTSKDSNQLVSLSQPLDNSDVLLRNLSVKSSHKCALCCKQFFSSSEFCEHMTKFHSKNSYSKLLVSDKSEQSKYSQRYVCSCSYTVDDFDIFKMHSCSIDIITLCCEDCGKLFLREDEYLKHLSSHNKRMLCDNIHITITNNSCVEKPERHYNVPQPIKQYSVNEIQSSNVNSILVQPKNKENLTIFACDSCSLTFASEDLLVKHKEIHPVVNTVISNGSVENTISHSKKDTMASHDASDYLDKAMDNLVDIIDEIQCSSTLPSSISIPVLGPNPDLPCKSFTCDALFSDSTSLELHKLTENHAEFTEAHPKFKINYSSENKINTSEVETLLDIEPSSKFSNMYVDLLQNDNQPISAQTEVLNNDTNCNSLSLNENLNLICDFMTNKKASEDQTDNSLSLLNINQKMQALPNTKTVKHPTKGVSSNKTPRKEYVCTICGFHSIDNIVIKKHLKLHSVESKIQCNICQKYFISEDSLEDHLKLNHSSSKICLHCRKHFLSDSALSNHVKEMHQNKQEHKCPICGKMFPLKTQYKEHLETHRGTDIYKCDECSAKFYKPELLKEHKDLTHRDPHCRFCGKEILKLKTLKNHELRHLKGHNNYECDVCKKIFKTKTGLRHHVAVHTGEYKYCCDYCGRGFMSRVMMEEHRSKHTKEERYVCDVCGKKFSFQSTYWIHRKWHDNPYPYKCNFCGRMYRHSSLLAVHKRKHTGERPYKCPHCSLTFTVGGTLKRHIILHTGVYPFNCDICKRGFTTRHKFAIHLSKIHEDHEMLNKKPEKNDFKMVIREKCSENLNQLSENQFTAQLNKDTCHKLGISDNSNNFEQTDSLEENLLNPDDRFIDGIAAARLVEIVYDEQSQAIATVTLSEASSAVLPELWYQ